MGKIRQSLIGIGHILDNADAIDNQGFDPLRHLGLIRAQGLEGEPRHFAVMVGIPCAARQIGRIWARAPCGIDLKTVQRKARDMILIRPSDLQIVFQQRGACGFGRMLKVKNIKAPLPRHRIE